MDPRSQSRHNRSRPATWVAGRGAIRVHSREEERYRCGMRGWAFSESRGTTPYRLRKPTELFFLPLVEPFQDVGVAETNPRTPPHGRCD